jgi:hypothetical protein
VLTGGPGGTSGLAAPVARFGPPWWGGWVTVTIVITIAITASAAATGVSRATQEHEDLPPPAWQAPHRGQHLAVLLADQRDRLGGFPGRISGQRIHAPLP